MKVLRVTNLPQGMSAADLQKIFSGTGTVLGANVFANEKTGVSYGDVEVEDKDAEMMIKQVNNQSFNGSVLSVGYPQDVRSDVNDDSLRAVNSHSKA